MQVQVNGESREVPSAVPLEGLLDMLQLKKDRVAVELNRKIVRREFWAQTVLQENDRLEIVHFVGGG